MRSILVAAGALAALLTLAALAPSAALADAVAPPNATPFVVADTPGDQTDPHVSGDLVAYVDEANGGSVVHVHDLATGSDVAIPNGDGLDFLPDVDAGRVVYTHIADEGDIRVYDVASATTTELDPQPASERQEARIGGQTVVWQDFGFTQSLSEPELVVYDLAAGTTARLTSDELLDRDPEVAPDGNTIVWTKCRPDGTGCHIWQATRSGGAWSATQLTSGDGEESTPDTNGKIVVYSSTRTVNGVTDTDVYRQPLGGGPEQELSLPGEQVDPHVSGRLITFESGSPGAHDIEAYDLATGTLYRLTGTAYDEVLDDVYAGPDGRVHVVWAVKNDSPDYNVLGTSFRLPPTSLALAPAGGSQDVDTQGTVTATASFDGGVPADGEVVRFALTGAVTATGSCTTAADGTCSLAYDGPAQPGTATIAAYVDANGNGTQDANEPAATATREFVGDTYGFSGFLGPVAGPPAVNGGKAGRTYPLRWQLTDPSGAVVDDLSAVASIGYAAAACAGFDATAADVDAATSGSSGLRFDADAGDYVYNWKTPGTPGCYVLSLTLDTGQVLKADFELR